MKFWSALVLAVLAWVPPAVAQQNLDQNAFFFGGRYTDQYFEYSFNPVTVSYEDNFVLGGGYQHFFFGDDGGIKLGAELGAAIRFGDNTSGEIWGGPVLRADKFLQTDYVTVSAAVTTGLSVTTDTIGIEAQREMETNGDTTLLFYLGPELSISPTSNPDLEFFWRVHHRSGAWETLGGLQDGANANVLGFRQKF